MAQYKVLDSENLYIVSNKLYGSVDYAGKLAIDNNLAIDSDLTGFTLEYDESIKSENVQTLVLKSKAKDDKTRTFKGRQGQSIFDVCLCTIGDLEQIITLVKNSGMENINDYVAGVNFSYTLTNNAIKQYSDKNNYVFSTGTELDFSRFSNFDNSFDQQAFL